MKKFFRKLFKWFAYSLLVSVVILIGVYIVLAFQMGKPIEVFPVFKEHSKTLVFAHRGGGGLYPENTLEAFQYSAKLGVDFLELDVHSTADGVLVVFHDRNIARITDEKGSVSKMTLAELKKLDAGYNFTTDGGKTFPFRDKGVTIPTLQEIFEALPEMQFNIEPKQAEPSITKPLCEMIRNHKMTDKVIIGSFRQVAVDEFRQYCPEVATSATPQEALTFFTMYKLGLADSYTPPMQALQIPQNLWKMQIVDKNFVEAAHKLNLQVHIWTINETEDMQRLIDAEADGIMTDYPDKLLDLVGR